MIEELHRGSVYLFKDMTQYTGIYSCAVPGQGSLSHRDNYLMSQPPNMFSHVMFWDIVPKTKCPKRSGVED